MFRREFIKQSLAGAILLNSFPALSLRNNLNENTVIKITSGGKQHWFGYYDKWQIDPSGKYALGMQADLFFRSPKPSDKIRIGIIDLENNYEWKTIGTSKAWGWQQGCMLQWIPGSTNEVLWNEREGNRFVCRIVNIKTGLRRTLPRPVYALSPDGEYAIGTEFNRIQNMRPGYGYAGIPDSYEEVKAPDETGIYRIDLKTGDHRLLISLDQVAQIDHQGRRIDQNWHYFNHLLVSPDGERFIFLHRWRKEMGERAKRATGGFITRMFTADKNGDDLYILDPSGNTSHFIWRDPRHICAWTKPAGKEWGFYLFEDQTENFHAVGKEDMTENGHNTYVPHTNGEWILNDTYPYNDPERKQTLYLYHVPSGGKVILGRFYEPPKFHGEWRCDLHPRCDQQGNNVFFDSTHKDGRRQMYMINIEDIIRK